MTRELSMTAISRGRPETVVSYDGTEMTRMAVLNWCQETGAEWHYIATRNLTPLKSAEKTIVDRIAA